MTESWHKTETDSEAEEHAADFWSRHRDELQTGEFWADRIKKFRGEPEKRLALAIENLPLPASFREAAIATRALIRDKRKQKIEYDEELALLYWLAAINSFSTPYSEVLKEPGYNVVESVPRKKLKGLPFSYKSLGYNKLELLLRQKNYPTQINKMCYSDAMKKTDGRSLPHSAREAIRRHAVAQVLSGESPEKVIKALGFHRSCIDDWLSRYEQGGEQALSTGKITGRPRKCPDEYADRLRELVKTNPLQLDFHDALWTRSMIQI